MPLMAARDISLKFQRGHINIETRRVASKSAYFIAKYNLEAGKITAKDTVLCNKRSNSSVGTQKF